LPAEIEDTKLNIKNLCFILGDIYV